MSTSDTKHYRSNPKKHRHYRKTTVSKSPFDNNPTLIVNDYLIPTPYIKPVSNVITLRVEQRIPFNRAVDQVASIYPNINRNKLAEHTLKTIANEY